VPALVVGVLVGAYLTTRMPILIVVQVLLAVDLAVLIYWFYFRGNGKASPPGAAANGSLRSLAEVVRAAGILLVLTAIWVTILGVLTQYGVTDAAVANWDAFAASGFQVSPEQPAAFGARSLVVAAAVWVVGFGLGRASGGRA
jgi:hypothetical protein